MFRVIIKNIKIRNFGSVKSFEYEFKVGINIIKGRNTEELSFAISLLLNNNVPFPATWAGGDTEISATVEIGEETYFLKVFPKNSYPALYAYSENGSDVTDEYIYLCSHCEEHNSSDMFDGSGKSHHLNFLKYANEYLFYLPKELSKKTDGFSNTGAFRSYLRSFINSFKPQTIRDGKKYEVVLRKNGLYDVQYSGQDSMPVLLSDSEQQLFNYLCFLNTAEFWRGFEEIRNLNGINKPLLIKNFLEQLDESIDVQEFIKRTKNLNRQVVILTLPSVLI